MHAVLVSSGTILLPIEGCSSRSIRHAMARTRNILKRPAVALPFLLLPQLSTQPATFGRRQSGCQLQRGLRLSARRNER